VCDKIAVVHPNWLEPVFALLSLDIGTHGPMSANGSMVPTGTVPSRATRREMPMRVNFVVALLIATGLSVTTQCARSVP